MLKVAKVLEIPVIVTEQNPKGESILIPLQSEVTEKQMPRKHPPGHRFAFPRAPSRCHHCERALLHDDAGSEGHTPRTPTNNIRGAFWHRTCVLQSALDLIEAGYNVHVIADSVSSSNKEEIPFALARIRQSEYGEACSLIPGDAGLTGFKLFSNVIEEEKDNTVRTSQKLLQHRAVL